MYEKEKFSCFSILKEVNITKLFIFSGRQAKAPVKIPATRLKEAGASVSVRAL